MTALPAFQRARGTLSLPGVLLFVLTLIGQSGQSYALGNSSSAFGGQGDFLPVDQALPFNYTTDNGSVVLFWDSAPV